MSITSVLGFDYGHKRIGVATGQTITCTATPLTTLDTGGDAHWSRIAELVAQWRPDALLVGIPYLLDGGETAMSQAARDFKQQLERRFALPVMLVDETLSSYQAEAILKQHMKIAQHNKAEIDKMAAAVIVQAWLDQQ